MGEQYNRVKMKYIQNVINMMTLFGDLLLPNKLKADAKRQVMTEETMKKKGFKQECTEKGRLGHGGTN